MAPLLILWILVPSTGLLHAQSLLSGTTRESSNATALFERVWKGIDGDPKMACAVEVVKPRLDFGLNLWTGWQAEFAIQTNRLEDGQRIITMFRVQSEATREQFLFGERQQLPKVPEEMKGTQKVVLGAGGGFRLGAGRYVVDWILLHPSGGVCRKSWKINAKLPKGMQAPMPANTAATAAYTQWEGFQPERKQEGLSATILLHAAPMRWRRNVTRLSAWERNILLGMLRAVLDHAPITKARVVAFDLEQGRTFFETDELTPEGYLQLAHSISRADFGSISLEDYKKGPQHWNYLLERLRDEAAQMHRSQATVFIGPALQYSSKPPAEFRDLKKDYPALFYLSLPPFMSNPQDHISQLVRSLDGKVLGVYGPEDLVKAVNRLSQDLRAGS